jgi:AcrR family transcriptional regulator
MAVGERNNIERAERILDAASKLIVHYGYDKTTVSDIAREAGISKGAIYLHWPSKEALFEALIFRESEKLVDDMLVRLEADPEAGTIFSLYQHSIMATLANPLIHALMTRDTRITGEFSRRWSASEHGSEGHFFRNEMVKQLQSAGVIRQDLDSDVVSYIMALIRYGFLTIGEIIPQEKAPPLDQVGKTLALMLERALAPEGGANKEAGREQLEHILTALREMVRRYRAQGDQT